jgi:ribonuclease PH
MGSVRADGRRVDQLRRIEITRGFTKYAPGSVLIRAGDTAVLCTACVEEEVPEWRAGKGRGWVTAEYDMLPGSTGGRRKRSRGKVDGRTTEIQRLIGRTLRAVVDFEALGERSIWLDCDVIQADGGTRTAAITGTFVALTDAVNWLQQEGRIAKSCIREPLAAVSVGKVDGQTLLDLNYQEDSRAEVDLNVAMTASGKFVEIQGTAESDPFDKADLDDMLTLAETGIRGLIELQHQALKD